ncbi:MAG: GNAT family N-acetyltransferase [Hyphomicrobiales bacterium]|nr:GNAT family N-acetyltransferase [Hyphomicrobiales bacterium]
MTRTLRGKGVTSKLLKAAIAYARAAGAKTLEAYPVDPDSPSYRFMGIVPHFEKAGFEHAGKAGTRRHVMRLGLG